MINPYAIMLFMNILGLPPGSPDEQAWQAIVEGQSRREGADHALVEQFQRQAETAQALIEQLQLENAALKVREAQIQEQLTKERKTSAATIGQQKNTIAQQTAAIQNLVLTNKNAAAEIARLNAILNPPPLPKFVFLHHNFEKWF